MNPIQPGSSMKIFKFITAHSILYGEPNNIMRAMVMAKLDMANWPNTPLVLVDAIITWIEHEEAAKISEKN